jgi:epoxyqueuosine reductase
LNNANLYATKIKQIALQCGFDFCGIAKAEFLSDDAKRLEKWLHQGYNGKMGYMENYFDLRTNPSLLVPNAKSVITVLKNYFPEKSQNCEAPKIAKYAYGKDYHIVIKEDLNKMYSLAQQAIGNFNGRGFVDSAPVLERAWAVKSGLGWVGKNGNLITKKTGSFFFIATLIVDVELQSDTAYNFDYCGTCTKCIDSCPTNAILPNKEIDGSKCISYFTIELKDALINNDMKGKFDNWFFGCDTCQDVCPWNRFSKPHNDPNLLPIPQILNYSNEDWQNITEETFKIIFSKSALKRTKYEGIQRNLKFIAQ